MHSLPRLKFTASGIFIFLLIQFSFCTMSLTQLDASASERWRGFYHRWTHEEIFFVFFFAFVLEMRLGLLCMRVGVYVFIARTKDSPCFVCGVRLMRMELTSHFESTARWRSCSAVCQFTAKARFRLDSASLSIIQQRPQDGPLAPHLVMSIQQPLGPCAHQNPHHEAQAVP